MHEVDVRISEHSKFFYEYPPEVIREVQDRAVRASGISDEARAYTESQFGTRLIITATGGGRGLGYDLSDGYLPISVPDHVGIYEKRLTRFYKAADEVFKASGTTLQGRDFESAVCRRAANEEQESSLQLKENNRNVIR